MTEPVHWVLLMMPEKSYSAGRIDRLKEYHQARMHYCSIPDKQCIKSEYGLQACRHIKQSFSSRILLEEIIRFIWITKPEVSKACRELINCSCKGDCSNCTCAKANIVCSPLFNCKYSQSNWEYALFMWLLYIFSKKNFGHCMGGWLRCYKLLFSTCDPLPWFVIM